MDHLPKNLINRADSHAVAHANAVAAQVDQLGEKTSLCATHGEYTSAGARYFGRREIWTQCPDCMEAARAKELSENAERQAEHARWKLESMIGAACIPKRFIGRTFDSFVATSDEQKTALRIAREYAESFDTHRASGTGLVYLGSPGTGKSHMAVAILQAIMPQYCGLYTTCMQIVRNVRGTWRRDSERSESDVLQAYCDAPLLVIDEIGVQYGTDGEQTILFDVLDRRYRDLMPTILLTNQDKKGFKQFIGDRSFDRLTETSRWVPFAWPSHRMIARRESVKVEPSSQLESIGGAA